MNVADLLDLPGLADDLARAERALRDSVVSMDPFMTEVGGHLVQAGGKRLRPALAVASALAGGADATDDVVQGGVAVELVHIGSLYHDDVMDEADSRRGVVSVNARWGNLVAIIAGDFLLAKASAIAASLGTEVAGLLAATIGRLCEGQVGELRTAFDVARSEDAYLASINGKTASLMACACRTGAITSGLPLASIDALTEFGDNFGMAFQIRDDVLDVVATDDQLGKPAGQDLVEGTYTLPVIRALASADVGDDLRNLLGKPVAPGERDKARELVRASGAVESALATARDYAERAAQSLESLGEQPAAAAMATAARSLLDLDL